MSNNGRPVSSTSRPTNQRNNPTERYTAKYAGYCKSYVPAEIDAEYKGVEPAKELIEWTERAVVDGYKIVLYLRKDGVSFAAEAHDMDTHSPLAGWRMSSFADSPFGALSYLRFKMDVVFRDGWVTESEGRETPARG